MLTNGAKGIIIAENVYYPFASLEARSIYLLQRSIVFLAVKISGNCTNLYSGAVQP